VYSDTAAAVAGDTRLRDAALELFAEHGVAATSLRAVARAADASPALVVHHFGSKAGLVRAVDEAVVRRITGALAEVPLEGEDVIGRRADAMGALLREDPALCDYLARALTERTEASADLFHRLFLHSRRDQGLVEAGALRADADPFWRAMHQMLLVLAPLLLRPLVERELGGSLLEPDAFARWMAATTDLLRRGLYT
jgi:TetR/AcrR family transcriptional regulator, regulator of cefoperazone and chloramphenicol sensitivity